MPAGLDLDTMIAALGYDLPLEQLPRRLRCPECGTRSIRVEWITPAERPTPSGAVHRFPAQVQIVGK